MTKIIAISNNKGGVGKTTTSTQLAYFFGEMCSKPDGSPLKVLACDLDGQGSFSSSLGIDKDDEKLNERTMAEFITRKSLTIDDVKIPVAKNIDLIPANSELENKNSEIANTPEGHLLLKRKLDPIVESNLYDYIIMDTAPANNKVVEAALIASNEIIIPIEPEKLAFEGIADILKFITDINKKTRYDGLPDRNILGVVFTKIDGRYKRHQMYITEGKKRLESAGFYCFNTGIHLCSTIGDSQTENKSVFEYLMKSRASIEYLELCKEIVEKEKKGE